MLDNDLLRILDLGPNTSGDEDVVYAAPRTPSFLSGEGGGWALLELTAALKVRVKLVLL